MTATPTPPLWTIDLTDDEAAEVIERVIALPDACLVACPVCHQFAFVERAVGIPLVDRRRRAWRRIVHDIGCSVAEGRAAG